MHKLLIFSLASLKVYAGAVGSERRYIRRVIYNGKTLGILLK